MDHLPPRSEEATKKMQDGHRKGRSRPSNLREQVDEQTMKLWPTPNAWDGNRGLRSKENLIEKSHQINLISAVKDAEHPDPVHMWPTPRARDYKDAKEIRIPPSGHGGGGQHQESQLGNESSRVYTDEGIWFAEPNVGRVAHGISKRMDRLKGLGNAIVPQIAMQIGLAIKKEIELS